MRHLDKTMEEAYSQPVNSLVLDELIKTDFKRPTLQEVCDWLRKEKGVYVIAPRLSDDRTCYECAIQCVDKSRTHKVDLPFSGSGGTYEDAINDAIHIVLSHMNVPPRTGLMAHFDKACDVIRRSIFFGDEPTRGLTLCENGDYKETTDKN